MVDGMAMKESMRRSSKMRRNLRKEDKGKNYILYRLLKVKKPIETDRRDE